MPIVVGHDPDPGLFGQAAVAAGQAQYGLEQAKFLSGLQEQERQRQFQAYEDAANRNQQVGMARLQGGINMQLYGQRIGNQWDMQNARFANQSNLVDQRGGIQSGLVDQRSANQQQNQGLNHPTQYDQFGKPIQWGNSPDANNQPHAAGGLDPSDPNYDESVISAAMSGNDPHAEQEAAQRGWISPTDAQKQAPQQIQQIQADTTLGDDEKQQAIAKIKSQPQWQPVPPSQRKPDVSARMQQDIGKDPNGDDRQFNRRTGQWDPLKPTAETTNRLNMARDKAKQEAAAAERQAEQKAKAEADGHAAAEKERERRETNENDPIKQHTLFKQRYDAARKELQGESDATASETTPGSVGPPPQSADIVKRMHEHADAEEQFNTERKQRQQGPQQPAGGQAPQPTGNQPPKGGNAAGGAQGQPQSHPELTPNAPQAAQDAATRYQQILAQTQGRPYAEWPPELQAEAQRLKAIAGPYQK